MRHLHSFPTRRSSDLQLCDVCCFQLWHNVLRQLAAFLNCAAALSSRINEETGPLTMRAGSPIDRKSTRLNSSHPSISYAVFCLKKKKTASVMLVRAAL